MNKIFMPMLLTSTFTFAGVKYCTPQSLGYEIAQEILKKTPEAKNYVYDSLCIQKAKESLRMGYNVNIAAVRLNCMRYITNRDKKSPKQVSPTFIVDRVKD